MILTCTEHFSFSITSRKNKRGKKIKDLSFATPSFKETELVSLMFLIPVIFDLVQHSVCNDQSVISNDQFFLDF